MEDVKWPRRIALILVWSVEYALSPFIVIGNAVRKAKAGGTVLWGPWGAVISQPSQRRVRYVDGLKPWGLRFW